MARLPTPGKDEGTWGDILNDFLRVAHYSDGTLKVADVIASKYTKPAGGIPKGDLSHSVQHTLTKAESLPENVVQSVAGKTGSVTLNTDDVPEGSSHLYYTQQRIVNTVTGQDITIFNNNAGYITGVAWGGIAGTLSDQADLQTAFNNKLGVANNLSDVTNASQARTNLGLGEQDSPAFGGLTVGGANATVGVLTAAPTHTFTLGATATGIALYNTSDQTTNFERVVGAWSGNVFNFLVGAGGSGALRGMAVGTTSRTIYNNGGDTKIQHHFVTTSTNPVFGVNNTGVLNASAFTGPQVAFAVSPTISQSGAAGYTALLINPSESSTGSGPKNLLLAQVGGADRFRVTNEGQVILANQRISNAADPAEDQDVATKKYVDDAIAAALGV